MKKLVFAVLFAFFAVTCAGSISMAQECPKDTMVLTLPMIAGFEETKLVDIIHSMTTVLEKKFGCKFKSGSLVFYHGQVIMDLVRKAFDSGEADISYINGLEHGEYLIEGGKDLYPIGVLAMQKSPIEKSCFFVRKGEYENAGDLRGAKWKGAQWLSARLLLSKAGIDERPDEFFGSIDFLTDSPVGPLIDQLKSGEVDVFNSYMHTVWLTGELSKKDPEIEAIGCQSNESHWVFVARSDIPEAFLQKFKSIMMKSHKDQDFAQFHFAFKMIDGRFIEMDEKIEKVNKEYAKIVKDNGWRKEEQEFLKKYYPDYKGK